MFVYFFVFQTFLIVATRLGRQYVFRFSKEKSLYLFGPLNALRKAIIILITNQYPFINSKRTIVSCVNTVKPLAHPRDQA